MPKFEGPYRVLEVRNNNLIIWKKGKRVTVIIDQVRVYLPLQSDTIRSDSHVETLYEGQRSSNGSSRSHPGKFKGSSKTSSEESKGRKSNKGNAGWEDPRLKRKGSQSIAGPSHLRDARQSKPPTEGSKQERCGQYDKARETRTPKSRTNSEAERRPARSKQATAVRLCPYYLRSRVKQPKGVPEDQRSIGIESIPQNNIRRRSLSETQWGLHKTETGTVSSNNGSLRDESSGFDRVQRRSNESQDSKKKGSEVKCELEEKGLSFKNNQGEKHTNKTNKRGPLIRSIPSSRSEKSERIKRSKNEMLGYKRSHESGSGGPERKIQKGSEHRVPKELCSRTIKLIHCSKQLKDIVSFI
ncbi:uncharacterized protein TNCV_1195991 [Trichonephila clavipes]|uniref:Uncharacterized protein n=1 Tax=Trichonephila clavipes TaxID=2585209 RepID=A0A8X6VDU8_TRICX|nr:uncharacterized protein TNCV_1195991 [Trichonephila clavipes]